MVFVPREQADVARHEVPGTAPPRKDRPVGVRVTLSRRFRNGPYDEKYPGLARPIIPYPMGQLFRGAPSRHFVPATIASSSPGHMPAAVNLSYVPSGTKRHFKWPRDGRNGTSGLREGGDVEKGEGAWRLPQGPRPGRGRSNRSTSPARVSRPVQVRKNALGWRSRPRGGPPAR
jgi:hypothetical protein